MSLVEETGKRIFLNYIGQSFHMGRDNVLEEYRGYKISTETEQLWAREEQTSLLARIRGCLIFDRNAAQMAEWIKNYYDRDGLLDFLSVIERQVVSSDTYTKMAFCRSLLDILCAPNQLDSDAWEAARILTLRLFDSTHGEPVTIDPYYATTPHLEGKISEDTIRRSLEEIGIIIEHRRYRRPPQPR